MGRTVKLVEIRHRVEDGRVRVSGLVSTAAWDAPRELAFDYPAQVASLVCATPDAFVPALLLPAMAADEPLEIPDPISPRLHRNLHRIQDTLGRWYPSYPRIDVRTVPDPDAEARGRRLARRVRGAATFFSGGVDSFYTLLKSVHDWQRPTPKLTHLIHVVGLESRLDDTAEVDARANAARVQLIAREAGVAPIIARTNLRTLFPVTWRTYHGSALAATASMLGEGLGHVLIPGNKPYSGLIPWGTHPLLDALWSTERLEIVHDGCEASRAQKVVRLLARDALARRTVRVCLHNGGGLGNCGQCVKCLRTMLSFHVAGVLDRTPAFDVPLPRNVERRILPTATDLERSWAEEILEVALETGADLPLSIRLMRANARNVRRQAVRELVETTPFGMILDAGRRLERLWRRRVASPSPAPRPASRRVTARDVFDGVATTASALRSRTDGDAGAGRRQPGRRSAA